MFRSKRPPISITIANSVLESAFDECDRYDADETGGRLLGTYQKHGGALDITVSGIIGPGPNARRTSTSFYQDGEYQEKVFRAIEARHPEVEHLGNWHTHHVNGYPTLSGGDISTYRNIVNHKNHNTDFFYALLVVHKNGHGKSRYQVKHFLFQRGDDAVYEIPHKDVKVADIRVLSLPELETYRHSISVGTEGSAPKDGNPDRATDQDFFAEFYPLLKPLYSEKLQAPYWKGALELVDGSQVDLIAIESIDGKHVEYSVAVGDHPICGEAAATYKGRKFPSARRAVIELERELNRELYRARK